MPSTATTRLTIRVTSTQAALLKTSKYNGKASSIMRTLLTLYLNGRLAVHDVESLINKEHQRTLIASNREDLIK